MLLNLESNFLLMSRAVFPLCCLTQGQTMVEVTKIMATSSKGPMHALLHSVPQTLQQATTNPRLCWRLLDTDGQVWLSPLWGHCSFLLGPAAHNVLFVPSKSLFWRLYIGVHILLKPGLENFEHYFTSV